ncbi:unnamed protein product, partial [Ixodes hexagonus]
KSRPQSLFFEDGKRRIDFVLAFGKGDSLVGEDARKIFEQNLVRDVFFFFCEPLSLQEFPDKKICFVKIHAPWRVLTKYAEILHLMMPVKVAMFSTINVDPARLYCTGSPPFWTYNYYGCRIQTKHTFRPYVLLKTFEQASKQDRRTAESPAPMLALGYERQKTDFGFCFEQQSINTLLNREVYLAAYPLHDLLYSEWARLAAWYKEQPINLIRRYFGVKTGLYFTWLGFYTSMLVLPAIVGIITTVYGFLMLPTNVPVIETCDPDISGHLVLCPACKKTCPYDYLSNTCTFSKVVYLFENPATVAFSIFIALWATVFVELWKRRQAVLKWEWKLSDLDTLSNVVKPEYEARARVYRLNPVTLNYEPYVPLWERILRISCSASVVILMVSSLASPQYNDLLLENVERLSGHQSRTMRKRLSHAMKQISMSSPFQARTQTTITSSNEWYLPEVGAGIIRGTRRHLLSGFTNAYSLFPTKIDLKFLKSHNIESFSRHLVAYPASHIGSPSCLSPHLFFNRNFGGEEEEVEQCCHILTTLRPCFPVLRGFTSPLAINWWRSRRHDKTSAVDRQSLAQWEADYDLEPWTMLSLFEEYLEMAIQFGFVTLFVMAFPLAPLFAFFNNIIEIRVDAYKYTTQLRRPLAQRVPNIG